MERKLNVADRISGSAIDRRHPFLAADNARSDGIELHRFGQSRRRHDLLLSSSGDEFGGKFRRIEHGACHHHGPGLPPGWTDADIGGPEFAGSASSNSGVMTVSGGGTDIWYSADQFNYVYQGLNGNGTIIAQVLTQGDTNPWAMAGVMIRNSVTNTAQPSPTWC